MQPRLCSGQEEARKSSALARAALIGSMFICDLKSVVNGAGCLAENRVQRVSYDVVSLGAETSFTLCFVQHLTLGGLPPKEVMMWPERTWMRLQVGEGRSQTPLLCTLLCGQLTSLNTALNTTFRPLLRVVVKYLYNNQYSFRLLAYFKPTSPISLRI